MTSPTELEPTRRPPRIASKTAHTSWISVNAGLGVPACLSVPNVCSGGSSRRQDVPLIGGATDFAALPCPTSPRCVIASARSALATRASARRQGARRPHCPRCGPKLCPGSAPGAIKQRGPGSGYSTRWTRGARRPAAVVARLAAYMCAGAWGEAPERLGASFWPVASVVRILSAVAMRADPDGDEVESSVRVTWREPSPPISRRG